jgi:hypothetical protein
MTDNYHYHGHSVATENIAQWDQRKYVWITVKTEIMFKVALRIHKSLLFIFNMIKLLFKI